MKYVAKNNKATTPSHKKQFIIVSCKDDVRGAPFD